MRRIQFQVIALLGLLSWNSHAQLLLGEKQFGKYNNDEFGGDIDLSANGKILAIGASQSYDTFYHAAYVRVLEWKDSAWHQLGMDIEGINENYGFGFKVALSSDGKTLVTGANDTPRLNVFKFQEGAWRQIGGDIYAGPLSQQITDVAISDDGNIIAVGLPDLPQVLIHRGAVRVFRQEGNGWVQLGQDIEGSDDKIAAGWSISLSADGKTLAQGAIGDYVQGVEGNVNVYLFENGEWIKKGKTIWGKGNGFECGTSLSLNADGNIMAVGSYGYFDEHQSFVRVYSFTDGTWKMIGQEISGYLNASLSADGKRITVSLMSNTSCPVILLDFKENQWIRMGSNLHPGFMYEYPGLSIAISNDGNRLASASTYQRGLVAVYDISTIEETNLGELCLPLDTMATATPISFYPNPTSKVLYVNGIDLIKLVEMHSLRIYSVLGQEVKRYSVSENQIDLSYLPPGVYVVQLDQIFEKIIKVDY